MNTRTCVLALSFAFLVSPALGDDQIKLYAQVVTLDDATACRTVAELDKYFRLAFQKDYEAAMKAREGCDILAKGTIATVEQTHYTGEFLISMRPSEAICIRPSGSPDCLWVARRMVGGKP